MQRVAAGQHDAQEAALRRLRVRVHVVSSAVLRHAQDAGDATLASLIQILRRAATYRGESSLEAWATRIAAREAIRIAQERRLRAACTTEPAAADELGLFNPPESSASIPPPVREILNELPETLRNTLVLRHLLGYTVPEIAELLRIAPNTVQERLTRARQEVRRRVGRDLLHLPQNKAHHA